jgi:hypothetical protein
MLAKLAPMGIENQFSSSRIYDHAKPTALPLSSSGNATIAAAESNQAIWKVAFTAKPTNVITAR